MPDVTVKVPQKHRLPLGEFFVHVGKKAVHDGLRRDSGEIQLRQAGELLALLSPTAKAVNIRLPVYIRDCAVSVLEDSDDRGLRRLAKLFQKAI